MKILAIRGCNLASLAGEFEIDLAHGPLGAAGVFAIVGPTGAGKSTLLDAMCVALFDRTPRLANRSTVVVGRGEDDPTALGAQDVRSLLRRGASTGWAEVDFESGDARRYRARWSVRRARNATDGRFQSQQVTLREIARSGSAGSRSTSEGGAEVSAGGAQLGGTKTETLDAIHQRLGLSFDQFRRSALLAQGEFAAFLRADGKDRSELLERMTGTEIYSRLSVAAHVRAALAEQQLRERHGAALAIAVLADDERARGEADLELARQAQQAARARLVAAEAAARWLAEDRRRSQALADAEAERAGAEAAVDAASAERAELALRRRAEALRPAWEEAARLDRQLALEHGELAAATQAVAVATTAQQALATRHSTLVELHEPIREARIAAGVVERATTAGRPVRAKARGRGGQQVHAGGDELQPTAAPRASATLQASADRLHASADMVKALGVRAQAAMADAAWLSSRPALGVLVGAWPDVDARLEQQAAVARAIAAAEVVLDEHARRRTELVGQRHAAALEHQQAVLRLTETQVEAASFQQKRGHTLDAARRAEDDARRRCSDFERLAGLAADARKAAAGCADTDAELAELQQLDSADGTHRKAAEVARDRAVLLRDERTRVVEELRTAAGYEHARAELVDGEPCPLCGAAEHPWKNRGAFDALIADAQARLAEATHACDAAVVDVAAIAARTAQRAKDHTRLVAARVAAERTLATLAATWREQLAALGELLLVADPATDAAAQLARERLADATARLESARAARSAAEAVAKAAAEAQARVQTRQADVEHHVRSLRELDAAIASLDAAAERTRGERAGKLERHGEMIGAIDDALGRWLGALANEDAPRPLVEHAREALAQDPLDARVAPLLAKARRELAAVAEDWQRRAGTIAELDGELAGAVIEVEQLAREAERALAEQLVRRDTASERRDRTRGELAEAVARFEAQREDAGFEVDQLRRLLSDEAAATEALATRLEQLDRAADRARTLVAERRRHRDDHLAASPLPPPSAEATLAADTATADTATSDAATADAATADAVGDATADANARAVLIADAGRLDELAAVVSAADHHAAALAAALAADSDARTRRTAALAQFAAAEQAVEVDRVLGQIIGSHDGKLFRSFAQSLTLDGLLAVANSHLEELAPRYQLERVPKHDLELQVIDRDLGNEIRSVQSLSGGESFLVSLALALGLSSMSAHDVRVRTLLIDEGFGTLDPATLDSALAVLDALQATGRQVGVISHVPALVERVGAHVRVYPRGGGKSEVVVAEA